MLNRAAIACENEDSNPATLVSGGWQLRSGRGPAQDMPPPNGLKLKQTGFAGLRNLERAYKSAGDAWARYDSVGESPTLLEWGENQRP